jgi:hypothetical protein
VGHEDVAPDLEVEVLLEIAGHEVGGARRNRRAQHEEVARTQHRQQVVEDRADVAHVDLDVRERRRPEGEDDRVGLPRVGGALGPRDVGAHDDGVGARLLEGHPPGLDRPQALGVLLDPQCPQPMVGEGERERQPDAPAADDRDVVAHPRRAR